ncbi:hypothetical protein Tco_1455748 [Tanacetum coccineum]
MGTPTQVCVRSCPNISAPAGRPFRRGRRPREGNDERVDNLNRQGNDQGQTSNRGNVGNQNGNMVNENVQENVGNVIVNGNRMQKLVYELWYPPWSVMACAYMNRFMSWLDNTPAGWSGSNGSQTKDYQKVVQILCNDDEAVRNRSIKKVGKKGNVGEPSKDKNGRDDNKRTRTGNAFATTANPVGRENTVIMEYLVKDSKRRHLSLNEILF